MERGYRLGKGVPKWIPGAPQHLEVTHTEDESPVKEMGGRAGGGGMADEGEDRARHVVPSGRQGRRLLQRSQRPG